jgi:signal transduction histidine kinase
LATARRRLRPALHEAVRLLRGDGGLVYLRTADPDLIALELAVDLPPPLDERSVRRIRLKVGTGMFGSVTLRGQVLTTGDYEHDEAFPHDPQADAFVRTGGIRSMVVAPLPGPIGPIGAMGVVSQRANAFDEADVALVRVLAEHAAGAIQTADLIRQLDTSRRELSRRIEVEQTLREIAARLTEVHDPAEVLQRTVDAAASLLEADGARIDLIEERGGGLHWGYDAVTGRQPGLGPIDGQEAPQPREGITGRAVLSRGPVWTGDYLADPTFEHAPAVDEFVTRHGIRSALAVPILSENRVLGTLTVFTSAPNAFDSSHAELLGSLADHASLAITNARLIEQLDRSRTELARQADVERGLREITAELSAMRDPQEILHRIAREGARLLGTERVFINVLNDPAGATGWTWYSPTEIGHDPWPVDEGILMGEGVTGKAIAERRPFITGDYLNDDRFVHKPGPDQYTADLDLPSAIAVPIFDGDEPVGGLLAESSVRDAFTTEDATRLEVLARAAGITLSNARRERELRRQAAELAASTERAHLARELHDSVTQALFAMTLVSRSIELLLPRDPEAASERFAQLRALQRDALTEMRSLVFELRPGSVAEHGLVRALETHAKALEARVGLQVGVEASLPERLPIEIEEALYRIAQEALHNVVRHASASRVKVRVDRPGGRARLTVEDDGQGFDPAQVPEGHLGLAGMRARAERLGGTVEVRSRTGHGTTVEVVVPLEAPARSVAIASGSEVAPG